MSIEEEAALDYADTDDGDTPASYGPILQGSRNNLRLHFKALKSALIDQPKVPKGQNEPLGEPKENLLIDKIILLLRDNLKATYNDLVTELSVSRSTIKRAIGYLAAGGHVVRGVGKRYGHWEKMIKA